jgi:hypothetical protein
MLKSVRIILAIAAYFDYEICQMDVKTAFLHGNLTEDMYMIQPEGFLDPTSAGKVCKLKRSIYGLKQASRSWNIHFDKVGTDLRFIKSEEDACLYKQLSGSSVVFLILFVDDILLVENDVSMLNSVMESLNGKFLMKDLSEAVYILGIKIYRDRTRRLLGLSQSTHIEKLLKRFNMSEAKKGFLPVSHGIRLSETQSPSTSDDPSCMP